MLSMYKEYVTNDRSCHLKTATNQVMTDDQELPGWCPPHVPQSTPSHHPSPPLIVPLIPASLRLK